MSTEQSITAQATDRLLTSDPEHAGSEAHIGHGVVVGFIGACVVAVIFLLIDSMTVGPLATPNALGHTLFLGETFRLAQPLALMPIVAYSLLHGAAFIGIAYFGSALVAALRPSLTLGMRTAIVGAAMFLACQAGITSLAYGSLASGELDLIRIGYANLFAAFVMARVLVHLVKDHPAA